MLHPDAIENGDYLSAVFWEWDAGEYAAAMGVQDGVWDHIDDAKVSADRTKILISCSGGWVAVYSLERDRLIFYTRGVTNAHSAEFLPGNKIAVACSTGADAIKIFDLKYSNAEKASTPLTSAHGVVWNEKRQRLYAIGGKLLRIYRLLNASTQAPSLELEKEINAPKSGLHDLSPIDDDRLCIGGHNAYIFNMDTEEFTPLTRFNGRNGIKSLNYNASTGEMWYTDSTDPEGDFSWSTQTVRHTLDPMGKEDICTFKTPDVNLYKVRVLCWSDGDGALGGIDSVRVSPDSGDEPVSWYNLQGMKVENPSGGIFIRRQGAKVTKELLKSTAAVEAQSPLPGRKRHNHHKGGSESMHSGTPLCFILPIEQLSLSLHRFSGSYSSPRKSSINLQPARDVPVRLGSGTVCDIPALKQKDIKEVVPRPLCGKI